MFLIKTGNILNLDSNEHTHRRAKTCIHNTPSVYVDVILIAEIPKFRNDSNDASIRLMIRWTDDDVLARFCVMYI